MFKSLFLVALLAASAACVTALPAPGPPGTDGRDNDPVGSSDDSPTDVNGSGEAGSTP